MLAEVRAGQTILSDGSVAPARAGRNGSMVMGLGQGDYYEQASRGNVFSVALTAWSGTIAAGNIVAAAALASTQFCLTNPAGSGKNISLLKFAAYAISGTAPVPALFHGGMAIAPTNVATVVTPVTCGNIGMAAATIARPFVSVAGTALTGNSAPFIIRASDIAIGAGATVPANLFQKCTEEINGDIVIPPGTAWLPLWMGTGTTFLGGYSVTWEEIPI